ncbi:MAG: hypothetical protein HQ472_07260 [Ignavibacteria bacterium]|nr:hypothetical protein [Ignavibacteria bacterium]
MTSNVKYISDSTAAYIVAVVFCVCFLLTGMVQPLAAQHLENTVTGRVKNNGTIRFKSDSGRYKNDAPLTSITNNVIEFAGQNNLFTDLAGSQFNTNALGQNALWRVPGMVRYALKDGRAQLVQQRYYTNLEMSDSSDKQIPDSVFVSEWYTIFLSGPRTYSGTFFYDGNLRQIIMQEKGLSGTVNRYNNLTFQNGPKTVASGSEVWMDGIFFTDSLSPSTIEGDFHWGSKSYLHSRAELIIGGTLTAGNDISDLHANVDVRRGTFIIKDDAGLVTIFPIATLTTEDNVAAELVMGKNTKMDVRGSFVNLHGPLVNTTFDITSLVNYIGLQDPQIMQATALTNPYGNLRTATTVKNASGDIHVAGTLSVNDTNVVMVPYTMNLTLGDASYTNNAEVVGNFRRRLTGAVLNTTYMYNNSETFFQYTTIPQELALDVRPTTRPNDYDMTTDVFRKVTVSHTGDWKAKVRVGYKAEDIPATWGPLTAERLLKIYNAYPAPNERSTKLTPTLPPTYDRRPLLLSTGIAYVELTGIQNNGPDNLRLDNGNDLLLRGSRDTLRAAASGRWSNPFTWDEAREPEPLDRVIIDGFTVHTGYVRANDNYAIEERWPDSMAVSVTISNTPASTLTFGSVGSFNTFSLVPNAVVTLTNQRVAPTLVPTLTQDITAADIDGGLIVYPASNFTAPNLILTLGATAFNAGTLQIGVK